MSHRQWLNRILEKVWPYYDEAICATIKVGATYRRVCRPRPAARPYPKGLVRSGSRPWPPPTGMHTHVPPTRPPSCCALLAVRHPSSARRPHAPTLRRALSCLQDQASRPPSRCPAPPPSCCRPPTCLARRAPCLQEQVEPLMMQYKPPGLIKRIYFQKLTFGDDPFRWGLS